MTRIRVDAGARVFTMDTDDPAAIEAKLEALGFQTSCPGRRQELVGASGRAFTTTEARAWLIARGHAVPARGRLSDRWLRMYAETH